MNKTSYFFDLMLKQNERLFEVFSKVHDEYSKDPKYYQKIFNEIGVEVQDVVRRYENMLCSGQENSRMGKFSTGLSEKFRHKIKEKFPKYNSIGLE
jgi:hypothetical protein